MNPEDTIDWRLVAYALCIKYGTAQGVAVVGDGTLAWVAKHAKVDASRDTSALTLTWESPPLTFAPASSKEGGR